MTPHYDVAIAGLGAMGSAAAYELTSRGRKVIGFDRFQPPHALGSSHGHTRIIREAYYEHPDYVPLVRRAYERWRELELAAGHRLFIRTGGLMVGPPEGALIRGARSSAEQHGVSHELLGADAIRKRFPAFSPGNHMVGLLEQRAGILIPELCVQSSLELAQRAGAELRVDESVSSWRASAHSVTIHTARGRYDAERLVIAVGPWLSSLVPELSPPLEVERQLFHWFAPVFGALNCGAPECPISLWEYAPDRIVATFPDIGHGVKVGVHHEGECVDPETVDRRVHPSEHQRVRKLLAGIMPSAAGRLLDSRVCLYTNTADRHFILDSHPAHPNVLIVSPCSGHGFKFASAIGEAVADLLTDRAPWCDLSLFSLARYVMRVPPPSAPHARVTFP